MAITLTFTPCGHSNQEAYDNEMKQNKNILVVLVSLIAVWFLYYSISPLIPSSAVVDLSAEEAIVLTSQGKYNQAAKLFNLGLKRKGSLTSEEWNSFGVAQMQLNETGKPLHSVIL